MLVNVKHRWVCFLLVSILAIIMPAQKSYATDASNLRIKVLDENGTGVPNAVISVSKIKDKQATSYRNKTSPAIMDQVDYQYVPRVLVIQKNQWVDFPNSDDVRHHVYSFSSPKTFEIKMYAGSDADPVQFEQSGIVVLGCNIHDSMVGYIYVSENEFTTITNSEGIANIPSGTDEITLWHPQLSTIKTEQVIFPINQQATSQSLVLNMSYEKLPTNNANSASPFSNKFKRH